MAQEMKLKRYTSIVIVLFSFIISIKVFSAPLELVLPLGEGGSQTSRSIESFKQYMLKRECSVDLKFKEGGVAGDIYFSAAPQASLGQEVRDYETLNRVKTYKNFPLTTAIIIKASTGVSDLSSVAGERLSIISETSYLGGEQVRKLYNDEGVVLDDENIYLTQHYEGAITLLLHGDVFVAAVPGPLARRWEKANNLNIIAESEPLDIGGMLIKKALSEAQKTLCESAFVDLKRTTRRDKRMNIFPAWVEGFQ